jgi:hypothetical protein
MVKTFKENNLYFLKEEDCDFINNSDPLITNIDVLSNFSDTELVLDKHLTVGDVVNKLIEKDIIKSQDIPWGSSIEDAMKYWNLKSPNQVLEESYDLVISMFDLAVFSNIYLLTGGEITNQIDYLQEYED